MKKLNIKGFFILIGKKKKLLVISGILTLVATFAMSWFSFILGKTLYANGMGGIQNLLTMFFNPQEYAFFYGVQPWIIIFMAIIIIFVLISGVMQLIGVKIRSIGLIGSIIPLLIGISIIIGTSVSLLAGSLRILEIFGAEPLIEGVLPFHLAIPGRTESIASYILVISGSLGITQITSNFLTNK